MPPILSREKEGEKKKHPPSLIPVEPSPAPALAQQVKDIRARRSRQLRPPGARILALLLLRRVRDLAEDVLLPHRRHPAVVAPVEGVGHAPRVARRFFEVAALFFFFFGGI